MITSRAPRPIVVAVLSVSFAGLRAGAEPPKGASAARIPQNLKLDPALIAKQARRISLPTTAHLDVLYATFKENFAQTKSAADAKRRTTDECLARAYTAREQQEAGCRPEDSVQICSEKLLCWCRRDASRDYSRRFSELEVANRELKAEIRRLYDLAQTETVEVTAQYRCVN